MRKKIYLLINFLIIVIFPFPLIAESFDHFILEPNGGVLTAGAIFTITIIAKDVHGNPVLTFSPEDGFKLTGPSDADDGTAWTYEPVGPWENGERTYNVRLYKAETMKVTAEWGNVRSTSKDFVVSSGEGDEVVIRAGDGQSGVVAKDVTEAPNVDLEVVVYDAWQNPVRGEEVMWTIIGGDGTGRINADGVGELAVSDVSITDDRGVAVCQVWRLDQMAGNCILRTSITNDTSKQVNFTAKGIRHKNGIIFNVDNIGLNLESYQLGIGYKRYFNNNFAIRGLLDFGYSNNSKSWLFTLGATAEYHFLIGRISPYSGGFLNLGVIQAKTEIDNNNWTKVTSIPLSFGPLFGIEIFIFDFFAIFAEYSLNCEYTIITTKEKRASVESKKTDSQFDINTGIGNNSKIGIILYFDDIGLLKKE
jgi:hypothetical protein